jgi:hypothetical protein
MCARCLMYAIQTHSDGEPLLDLSGIPAATTAYQGEALCTAHFHTTVALRVPG